MKWKKLSNEPSLGYQNLLVKSSGVQAAARDRTSLRRFVACVKMSVRRVSEWVLMRYSSLTFKIDGKLPSPLSIRVALSHRRFCFALHKEEPHWMISMWYEHNDFYAKGKANLKSKIALSLRCRESLADCTQRRVACCFFAQDTKTTRGKF